MSPDAVRYAGIVVELVGLGLVAWGIRDTAHRFDRSVTAPVRALVRRAAAWRPFRKNTTVRPDPVEGTSTVSSDLTVRWG